MPVAKPSTSAKNEERENAPLLLPLNSRNGGFAPVGNKFETCYDSKQDLSKWVRSQRRRIVRKVGSSRNFLTWLVHPLGGIGDAPFSDLPYD